MPGTVERDIMAGGRCRAPSDECYDRVHMTPLFIGILLGVAQAATPPASGPSRPFAITDNSFLVEEAFNQEPRIFQNIFGLTRTNGDWQMTFTQEWPAPGETPSALLHARAHRHRRGRRGFGDALMNYRLQVLEEGPGRPAFSPRVSAILPTGRRARSVRTGRRAGEPAVQQAARTTSTFTGTPGSPGCRRQDRADLRVAAARRERDLSRRRHGER